MVPASQPMYSVESNMACPMLGFPIRKSPDQSLLTASRGLSQSSTSFICNIRLGIHLAPLSTFLCIDLTSRCCFAMTKPSINKNSFLNQIVNVQHPFRVQISTHQTGVIPSTLKNKASISLANILAGVCHLPEVRTEHSLNC